MMSNFFNIIKKDSLGSLPRVDMVLLSKNSGWNITGGWINAVRKMAKLGKIFFSDDKHDVKNLFRYLNSPQSDIIILPGFDHHMVFLHDAEKWKDRWRSSKIFKILLAIEPVLQEYFPDSENKTTSALSCVDMVVYPSAKDIPFFGKHDTPSFWKHFGVDETVYTRYVSFRRRSDIPFFRGKVEIPRFPQLYQRRRDLLDQLKDIGLVNQLEYKSFDSNHDITKELVDDYNNHKISLNLPASYHGFVGRVFESMACGSISVTPRPTEPLEIALFGEGKHIVYYDPLDGKDLVEKLLLLKNNQDQAEIIAWRGHEEILEKHTISSCWENIMKWHEQIAGKQRIGPF